MPISRQCGDATTRRALQKALLPFRNELIRERVEHDKTKSNYEETIKLPDPEPEVFEPATELVTTTKDGGSF